MAQDPAPSLMPCRRAAHQSSLPLPFPLQTCAGVSPLTSVPALPAPHLCGCEPLNLWVLVREGGCSVPSSGSGKAPSQNGKVLLGPQPCAPSLTALPSPPVRVLSPWAARAAGKPLPPPTMALRLCPLLAGGCCCPLGPPATTCQGLATQEVAQPGCYHNPTPMSGSAPFSVPRRPWPPQPITSTVRSTIMCTLARPCRCCCGLHASTV